MRDKKSAIEAKKTKLGSENKKRPKIIEKIRKTISKPKRSLLSILKLEESQLRQNPHLFSNFTFAKIRTLKDILKRSLKENKFERLTQIQAKSYNPVLKMSNCVIKSETGSGKTLAYLVPLLNTLLSKQHKVTRKDGVFILILCPVRELCLQILALFEKLNQFFKRIVAGKLIGGEETKREKARLRKGFNVLVATPGRLLYHVRNTRALDLSRVEAFVIEECDKLLDIGMKQETQEILRFILDRRAGSGLQYVLVSASITNRVEELLYFIKDCEDAKAASSTPSHEGPPPQATPKLVEITEVAPEKRLLKFKRIGFDIPTDSLSLKTNQKKGARRSVDESFKLPTTINHFFLGVNEKSKVGTLFLLLKLLEREKVMVFLSTADQVNFLHRLLSSVQTVAASTEPNQNRFLGCEIHRIHGHMDQDQRSRVFTDFGRCREGILLSTDIGSRGLDFLQTKFIIQFDLPASVKGYVNRVGRTARISSSGSAISLVFQSELGFIQRCHRTNGIAFEPLQMDELAKFINVNQDLQQKNFFEDIFVSFRDKSESESLPTGFVTSNFTRSLVERVLFLCKNEVRKDEAGRVMARRAFNSFCRAYSQTKLKEIFRLKRLNLHVLAKGFCLDSAKSEKRLTTEKKYTQIQNAKTLAPQQLKTLEKKNFFTRQGIKNTRRRDFLNSEFM